MTDDDARLVEGIAYSFGVALGAALANTDDLLEGFLSGRYSLHVAHNGMTVLTAPAPDLHAELEGGG